jgi:CrcB protein
MPWGTLLANLVGSFLLGLVASRAAGKTLLGVDAQLVLGVGVMGGFTTYSSFNLETIRLFEEAGAGRALLYVSATLIFCLAGGAAGLVLGRGSS